MEIKSGMLNPEISTLQFLLRGPACGEKLLVRIRSPSWTSWVSFSHEGLVLSREGDLNHVLVDPQRVGRVIMNRSLSLQRFSHFHKSLRRKTSGVEYRLVLRSRTTYIYTHPFILLMYIYFSLHIYLSICHRIVCGQPPFIKIKSALYWSHIGEIQLFQELSNSLKRDNK